MKKPKNYQKILDLLEERWQHEADIPSIVPLFEEPLDDLILTLLSQNTNDINRDKAYDRLRTKFPTWEQVANATKEEIKECIKVAGLGESKSSRMKIVLDTIKEKFGKYSIKELCNWESEEIRSFLTSLPGIGIKTAGVVMVFDLGKPAFPVDTHLARISKRLGWAGEKTPPDKIQ
ncbi:MAG: endonuclease III [Synergistaceae bacterium]